MYITTINVHECVRKIFACCRLSCVAVMCDRQCCMWQATESDSVADKQKGISLLHLLLIAVDVKHVCVHMYVCMNLYGNKIFGYTYLYI